MKRVLAFCFFPAFTPPSNGGQSRLFHFYQALSRWHQITLLTSTHPGDDEVVINHGINFVERRIPKGEQFAREYAALEQYSGGGDLSGPAIAACGKWPTRLHRAYLEEYDRADIIIHDFPFTVDYDLFAGADEKPRVYNAHNSEAHLYRRLHPGAKSGYLHDLVEAAEQRILENANLVLYCSEGDLTAFRRLAPNSGFEALYTPNGMTATAARKDSSDTISDVFRAVFMGSGHPPNVQAAEFIVRTLAPAMPEVAFDIIGGCLPEDGRYPDNVQRYGIVDDAAKTRILRRADLALNPMTTGSGSNVKVLEYFAYGLPVLSTPMGMRGIQAAPGEEYLESNPDQFPQALKRAAADPISLAAIGQAGQSLGLKQYTWDVIAQPVAERLATLVSDAAASDADCFVLVLNDYDSFATVGGGGTRTRSLYEAVRGWSSVVAVSFSTDGTLSARWHSPGIRVINVPRTAEHDADLATINAQYHVSADDIIASRHSTANPWLDAVYRLLRQSARCVVVEHCYLVPLPLSWGDRFVYSSHNNETELKRRLLEQHPLEAELLSQVERIERQAVERSAAIAAVSREDAISLVKGKRTAAPVIVVRNGAATPATGADVDRMRQDLCRRIGDYGIVFLGSAHPPNVEAARFIVDELAPRCPDLPFHVLGSVCGALLKVPANVRLWGVVDEVTKSAVMQSCAIALNPMKSGSGSNIKLADYLANGLFVITTEFGQRGYPSAVEEHLAIEPLDRFAEAIWNTLEAPELYAAEAKTRRQHLFQQELAMQGIAERFVEMLQGLEKHKKRILYVAYRYTAPALGGAETNIEKFVGALGRSGEFDIDVVAPEVSSIHSYMRFSETYTFDPDFVVPVDIPNTRFARFPADEPDPDAITSHLHDAWSAQVLFDQVLERELRHGFEETGLTWGWGYPEGEGAAAARWTFSECGVFLHEGGRIECKGFAAGATVTTIYRGLCVIAGPYTVKGKFSLSFDADAGEVRLVTSAPQSEVDPRPLGFTVSRLTVAGRSLNLAAPTLLQKHLSLLPAERVFRLLDQAAEESRASRGVRLSDGRGPWSRSLERFIVDHVADYDLVVTHNNVFRPPVVAIDEAKKQGVPSILIPHAHLDDDFYHFPDWIESARNATRVLATPRIACDFLIEKGCNTSYLPAGCDSREQFSPADQEAFLEVHSSPRPFVLVLGRKAGAKGYRQIIEAVENLNREGVDLEAILIGPDDDGVPVAAPNTKYLGRQSRNVVRGALLSCFAVCNMSSSESFGIVLLEAWLAGKPVIANKHCAAFHDLAVDKENALLVGPGELAEAIHLLHADPELAEQLGRNGKQVVTEFDWDAVSDNFRAICESLVQNAGEPELNHEA
ncbi:glycosyltransferase [Salinisphaera sp. RV14]|uniref:glycosyltransferase n=1 Tax=Salinisphaera sp. RV14 TaxID=3454140 RepID=UPI003F846C63